MNRCPLFAALALLMMPLVQCDTLVDIMLSDEEEVELGEKFYQEIISDTENYPLYEDNPNKKQELIDYVDSIGRYIADRQRDRTEISYYFTIIDQDDVINAFAIPGGHICVYIGLIKAVKDEAELAGVLGHEIAHVTNRHGAKTLVRQHGYTFLMDILLGDESSLRTILDITTGLGFLKYSRTNEYEADSCSVEYLALSGFNPEGMGSFLSVLAEKESGGLSLQWLSTHPPTDERMARVSGIIDGKSSLKQACENTLKPNLRVTP